ncbi:MAG: winged helix-turn-helix domain-containing protein [Candidatus Micrarchaeaceae archaeon]
MTKYGLTKSKIIELISEGVDNLKDISKQLNLAQSTVSKHLEELESLGVIELMPSHLHKWKHYKIANASAYDAYINKNHRSIEVNHIRSKVILPIIAIAAAIGLLYAFSVVYNPQVLSIPISLTDPPHVPIGTQALYINYSSFAVLVNDSGIKQWLPLNGTGRINLLSIVNVSEIIGTFNIGQDGKVYAVKFNISSASITINNVTYPVAIAGGMVNATISTHAKLNSSSNLIVDLMPIVIPTYNNGNYEFVMIPFLNAAFGTYSEHNGVGSTLMRNRINAQMLNNRYVMHNNPFNKAINISIKNPSLKTNGNETLFNVSIENTGNTAIELYGIILEGNSMASIAGQHWNIANSDNWSNIYTEANGSLIINASAIIDNYGMHEYMAPKKIILPHPINAIIIQDDMPWQNHFKFFMQRPTPCIDFAVEANGTLNAFPTPFFIHNQSAESKYILQPHSEETFVYEGRDMKVAVNSTYDIIVLTNEGVTAINGIEIAP